MPYPLVLLSLTAVAIVAAPASAPQWFGPAGARAEQWPAPPPPAKAKPKPRPRDDVEELTPGQIKRAQELDPPGASKDLPKAVKRPSKGGPPARQIACSGPFAADSGHIRLAQVFGSDNVAFTEVAGPKNSKLMASVLFPKDPQRRLEVLWRNNTTRTGVQVIAINGKSGWMAPRGLRLGMQLAAIEKINGKPFKISGFGPEGSTTTSWEDGAMLKLPGGCKIGLILTMDQRVPGEARSKFASAKELTSNDTEVRAVRPAVSEILIGY